MDAWRKLCKKILADGCYDEDNSSYLYVTTATHFPARTESFGDD